MLELIDLDHRLPKDEYRRRLPLLRSRLLQLQQVCWYEGIASVLVFEGWDGAGKGDAIRKLTERLEPRGFKMHYIADTPRSYALDLPWMWRFWLATPARGEMAIFDRSWNRRALVARVEKGADELAWRRRLRDIVDFERMLADDGTVFIKIFLHLSKGEQKKRYKKWDKDPETSWRLEYKDWLMPEKYGFYRGAVEELLEATDTAWSPWTIIPATQRRYVRATVFATVIDRLEEALTARGVSLPEPWISENADADESVSTENEL